MTDPGMPTPKSGENPVTSKALLARPHQPPSEAPRPVLQVRDTCTINLLVRALRATPRGTKFSEMAGCRTWPTSRRCQRWTPERHNYETRAASGSWVGPDMGWVGSALARRRGWHVAEQAALEVDRVVRLGRPVQNRRSLATHFARCFARPQQCHRRHQGAYGNMRLNQHRARRLDEQLETRTPHNDRNSPNPTTEPRRTVPVTAPEPRVIDQAQLEAALARLPTPLATQLARLATRHHIISEDPVNKTAC